MLSPNSTTGGGLQSSPLEGLDLNRFFQQWFVSITGLEGQYVRPRWLAEPSNIPAAGVVWCALGITRTIADVYPYIEGGDLQRHEDISILSSFYDLGTNGMAQYYAALFRDGTAVPQNLEILQLNGMGLIAVGEMTTVPSLLKERWLYRVDVPVSIRRVVQRNYQVLTVESADLGLNTGEGFKPIIVTEK